MFGAAGQPLGMRQLGVQEVDIVSIVKPITKYAVTVVDPQSIRYEMGEGRPLGHVREGPGPVWIDIPLDVQASPRRSGDELLGFDPPEQTAAMRADLELGARIDGVIELSESRGASTAVRRQRHPAGPCRKRDFSEMDPAC